MNKGRERRRRRNEIKREREGKSVRGVEREKLGERGERELTYQTNLSSHDRLSIFKNNNDKLVVIISLLPDVSQSSKTKKKMKIKNSVT